MRDASEQQLHNKLFALGNTLPHRMTATATNTIVITGR